MGEYFYWVSTRSASTTTSRSTRMRIGSSLLLRRPVARRSWAMSSTSPRLLERACKLGRPGRWLADGAADHRDAGRRHRRVHPHERHLDHRRPDLPRVEPVLLGRPPGDQRRHVGLSRRRERTDESDEEGGRTPAARPRPVPRARGVRAVRLGARPGDAERARPRRADGGHAEPAAVPAVGRRGAGRRSTPGSTAGSTRCSSVRCRGSTPSCASTCAPRDDPESIRESGDISDETAEAQEGAEHFQGVFNIEEEKGLAG